MHYMCSFTCTYIKVVREKRKKEKKGNFVGVFLKDFS